MTVSEYDGRYRRVVLCPQCDGNVLMEFDPDMELWQCPHCDCMLTPEDDCMVDLD